MAATRIRLLSTDGPGSGPALARHLHDLQRGGPVLFVTADRPAASWMADWAAASVDLQRLHVIDAVSAMNGTQPARGAANVTFLPSPAMLEMIALRIEQLIRRHAAAHVVLDSLDALALYNGPAGVQAFAHYLANRLRGTGVGADLLVHPGREGEQLCDRLAAVVDGRGLLAEPQPAVEMAP